jgi:hypothetical protein
MRRDKTRTLCGLNARQRSTWAFALGTGRHITLRTATATCHTYFTWCVRHAGGVHRHAAEGSTQSPIHLRSVAGIAFSERQASSTTLSRPSFTASPLEEASFGPGIEITCSRSSSFSRIHECRNTNKAWLGISSDANGFCVGVRSQRQSGVHWDQPHNAELQR